MIRDTRRYRRPYLGRIEFNERRIRRWIRNHRSFASKEFLEGAVRYHVSEWIPMRNRRNWYRIFTDVVERGIKIARVVIHFAHYPNGDKHHSYEYVYIDHAHARGRG